MKTEVAMPLITDMISDKGDLKGLGNLPKKMAKPENIVLRTVLGNWKCAEAVAERLTSLKLLSDKFLYSAAPGKAITSIRKHGTYRIDHGKNPKPHVYCCELTSKNNEITQVNNAGPIETRHSLWNYMNQNVDEKGVAIIVWVRDALNNASGEEGADSRRHFLLKTLITERLQLLKLFSLLTSRSLFTANKLRRFS